jgi:type II secretory pathway pseudopilin PulG
VAAFSLIELLFVLGIAATISVAALPGAETMVDQVRAAGAARYLAARLQQTRVRAIARGRDTAVRITADAHGFRIDAAEDGNRNGVLSSEVANGTDPLVGSSEYLRDRFPGVEFGALPGLPGAEGSGPPGADPIRLGSGHAVTFTPVGTATPGSLYLKSRGGAQYVVRIYGETGRTRILKYSAAQRTWSAR